MKKKTATNISLPEPILRRFDAMAATLAGGQTKWIVATASMLALLQMDAKARRSLFSRVTGADAYEGGLEELIGELALDDPIAIAADDGGTRSEFSAAGSRVSQAHDEEAPKKRTAITSGTQTKVVTTPLPRTQKK